MLLNRNKSTSPRTTDRRGAVLFAVVVILTIAALLFVSWIKTAAIERRQLRDQELRLQTDWLADSALDRAAAQLDRDPNYRGETWQLPAEELAERGPAAVTIRIESVPEQPRRRLLSVSAAFPSGSDRRATRSKQAVIELP